MKSSVRAYIPLAAYFANRFERLFAPHWRRCQAGCWREFGRTPGLPLNQCRLPQPREQILKPRPWSSIAWLQRAGWDPPAQNLRNSPCHSNTWRNRKMWSSKTSSSFHSKRMSTESFYKYFGSFNIPQASTTAYSGALCPRTKSCHIELWCKNTCPVELFKIPQVSKRLVIQSTMSETWHVDCCNASSNCCRNYSELPGSGIIQTCTPSQKWGVVRPLTMCDRITVNKLESCLSNAWSREDFEINTINAAQDSFGSGLWTFQGERGAALIFRSSKVLQTCGEREHKIIEQCAFVHVALRIQTWDAPT